MNLPAENWNIFHLSHMTKTSKYNIDGIWVMFLTSLENVRMDIILNREHVISMMVAGSMIVFVRNNARQRRTRNLENAEEKEIMPLERSLRLKDTKWLLCANVSGIAEREKMKF